MRDFERTWREFWAPIIAPRGTVNMTQLKKELHDFRFMMTNTAQAFDEATGGLASKPMTRASVIGNLVREREQKWADWLCDEGECKCAVARDKATDLNSWKPEMCMCGHDALEHDNGCRKCRGTYGCAEGFRGTGQRGFSGETTDARTASLREPLTTEDK